MAAADLLIRIRGESQNLKGTVEGAVRDLDKLAERGLNAGTQLAQKLFPPSLANAAGGLLKSVGSLTGAFGGLGGVVAAVGIGQLASEFVNTGSALTDLSAQTDINVIDLQRFAFAGELVGVSLEEIAAAVGQLQNRLGSGDRSAFAALDDLGLSFKELQDLDPGQQFERIASEINKIPDPTRRAAVAMDLFGRGGVRLMPLIRSGVKETGDQAFFLSKATIAAADAFDDLIVRGKNLAKAALGGIVFGPIVKGVRELHLALINVGDTFNLVRGKMDRMPEILGPERLKPQLMDPADFKAAISQSEDLDRKIAQSAEDRSRKQKQAAEDAARAFAQSSQDMVKRIDEQTEAHHRMQLWVGRNTIDLKEMVQTQREQLEVLPALAENYSQLVDSTGEMGDLGERLQRSLKETNNQLADEEKRTRSILKQAGEALDANMTRGLNFGKQLSQVIMGSIQGGGDIGNAVGAFLGEKIGSSLGKKLAESVGGAFGGALGGMLGPLGALGGQLLGGLFDKIFGRNTEGRDLVKTFAESLGGFVALQRQLETLGSAGEQLWVNLTQGVGRNNPQQAQAAIDAITAALSKQKSILDVTPPSFADVQAAAARYGLEVDHIGDGINGLRVSETAAQAVADWSLMERAGADMSQVAAGMADEMQNLVIESLRWGHDLPQAMRPILERLVEMGLLTDEAGNKLNNLDDVKWAKTLDQSLDSLSDSIDNLATKIDQGLNNAFRNIRVPEIDVPYRYRAVNDRPVDEIPAFASGGIVTRPTLALIGESGPEAVVPLGGGKTSMAPAADRAVLKEIQGMRSELRQQPYTLFRVFRDAAQMGG